MSYFDSAGKRLLGSVSLLLLLLLQWLEIKHEASLKPGIGCAVELSSLTVQGLGSILELGLYLKTEKNNP